MIRRTTLPTFGSLLLLLVATMLCITCGGDPGEHWPSYTPNPAWKALAEQAVADYTVQDITYLPYLQTYQTSGDWLNYGATQTWEESTHLHFDSAGVPMILYGNTYQYNPVTVAQFALSMHGKFIRGLVSSTTLFLNAVDRLLLMQEANGAIPYPFQWTYYLTDQPFEPGWVSGMAQGVALSAFARAYLLTHNPKYLTAGDLAFGFLLTGVSSGGPKDSLSYLDPSLRYRAIFEEYIVAPASYTLNGFMFTLIGIFDWSTMGTVQAAAAANAFSDGLGTLDHILPYYDIGGFTAYDMTHITYQRPPHIGVYYHAAHIYLLHALSSISGDTILSTYEKLWSSYVPH